MSKKNKKEEKEYQVVKTGSDPKNRIVELIHIPSEIPKDSFWGIKKEHYVFESGSEKQAQKDFDFYISCSQAQY